MIENRRDVPVIAADAAIVLPKMQSLQRGEKVIYHTGNLMEDRIRMGRAQNDPTNTINHLARTAWRLYGEGKVHLVQRMLKSPNGFPYYQYIAIGA